MDHHKEGLEEDTKLSQQSFEVHDWLSHQEGGGRNVGISESLHIGREMPAVSSGNLYQEKEGDFVEVLGGSQGGFIGGGEET